MLFPYYGISLKIKPNRCRKTFTQYKFTGRRNWTIIDWLDRPNSRVVAYWLPVRENSPIFYR